MPRKIHAGGPEGPGAEPDGPTTGVADPPLSRRERKKAETRAALQAAALDLFARRGFRETRISDITEAADVSEATFFRYFATKEDVALDGIKQRIDDVVDALATRPDSEPPIAACLAVMDTPGALNLVPTPQQAVETRLLLENPGLSGHFFWHVSKVTQRLTEDFARRLGQRPVDLEPRVLANAVIGALNAVLQVYLGNPGGTDPWALARKAFVLLAAGLEPTTAAR